jgi:dihydroorotase
VFDPDEEWTVDPGAFESKSRNTPFTGRKLRGRVRHTFFNGRRTVRDARVLAEVTT